MAPRVLGRDRAAGPRRGGRFRGVAAGSHPRGRAREGRAQSRGDCSTSADDSRASAVAGSARFVRSQPRDDRRHRQRARRGHERRRARRRHVRAPGVQSAASFTPGVQSAASFTPSRRSVRLPFARRSRITRSKDRRHGREEGRRGRVDVARARASDRGRARSGLGRRGRGVRSHAGPVCGKRKGRVRTNRRRRHRLQGSADPRVPRRRPAVVRARGRGDSRRSVLAVRLAARRQRVRRLRGGFGGDPIVPDLRDGRGRSNGSDLGRVRHLPARRGLRRDFAQLRRFARVQGRRQGVL
mmetsp:Transcript_4109/g.16827  ORF Transcript_4109/g.16827 Transcript_4109/m.16827 type:complete len:298 (-) Transcript_4109:4313-5206(-)